MLRTDGKRTTLQDRMMSYQHTDNGPRCPSCGSNNVSSAGNFYGDADTLRKSWPSIPEDASGQIEVRTYKCDQLIHGKVSRPCGYRWEDIR